MDILALDPSTVDIGACTGPTEAFQVTDITYNDAPLRMKIRGFVVQEVKENFGKLEFFFEPEQEALDKIMALENLYQDIHPEVKKYFKFKSCIVEEELLRIKLRPTETGRRFAFGCNQAGFTPSNTTHLQPGYVVTIAVDPKFYFCKDNYGMFLQLQYLSIEPKRLPKN